VTALATLPLLTLGAEVTTKKVGMVDPVGFRAPWHLAQVWQEGTLAERGLGYLIEHSHRIAGFVVGSCAIILAAGLWFGQPRRWLKWLGLAGLLAVSAQGGLGIIRVNYNAVVGPPLALVHGLTAQLVFALLVSLTVFTSRGWARPVSRFDADTSARLRRLGLSVLALIYLQLVLGAIVRHAASPGAVRLHVVTASLVSAGVAWLLKDWFAAGNLRRGEKTVAVIAAGLLVLQLVLGVEAWLSKFQVMDRLMRETLEPIALHPDLLRSLHFVVGALVFSSTLVVTLLIFRRGTGRVRRATLTPDHTPELEGVA
jgi:cytochrome c oxidase assembly protein subunit 15